MNLKKISILLLAIMTLAACSTQKKIDKAKDILHENRQAAAAFCTAEFPDSNILIVTVDSSGYHESVNELQKYCDSILNESEARQKAINNLAEYIDAVEKDGKYSADIIAELQTKLLNVKPVNLVKLRADIERQIRASIKPCKDSIEIRVPTKQIEYWKMESKKYQDQAAKFQAKNKHKGKWIWWLSIYAVAMTIFAFRKIIFKLLI